MVLKPVRGTRSKPPPNPAAAPAAPGRAEMSESCLLLLPGGRTVKFERVLSPHSLPHVAVINIMNQVRHIKVYQIVTSYFGLAQLITLDLIQLDRGTLSYF